MMRGGKPEICVLGAGVVGLSTALAILEDIPSVNVTIVADKLQSQTLSYGAGGFFRPEANMAPDRETAKRWAQHSYDRYSALAVTDPISSGNQFVSGYQISSHSESSLSNELVESIVASSVRPITAREQEIMFPERFKYGIFWTTIITDPRYYLPYLQDQITQRGSTVQQKYIESFESLLDWKHFDLVVNCTGLRAAQLAGDHRLTPVRGQTFKVEAPWIRHFYFADGAYILPGRDYVTLGGIKDYGNSDMSISELDRKSIWTRCTELVPSLCKAKIAFEWVGLRPQRQPIRVELERLSLNTGESCPVVHNYGHGGHGVTFSWGTAKDATSIVHRALLKSKL